MQQIALKKVIPVPLTNNILNSESIWGKDVLLETKDIVLVCAPSGTGKTTLISCLYGLRNDYSGTLFFDNTDIHTLSLTNWYEIRQKQISIVFQELLLFPELTAFENILLKQKLQALTSPDEIKSMASDLQIEHLLDKKCGILSLGQQQRVAIIRALCQPFSFLLLDEPFSHLDEANGIRCAALIHKECLKRNAALITTSLGSNNYFPYTKHISV